MVRLSLLRYRRPDLSAILTFRPSVVRETIHPCNGSFLLTMASADFCLRQSKTGLQTSQGKCIRFPFMWLLHIRRCIPYSIGLLFLLQHHPYTCAFMQFLFVSPNVCRQIPSRDGHPCSWLRLPTVKRLQDFHLIADTHGWRTIRMQVFSSAFLVT